MTPPVALTIAGSDSGGGAGIQADLKTFAALGAFGASVVTAVTAQNTCGVRAVHPIPLDLVTAQAESVLGDLTVAAVKTGMLGTATVVRTVADLAAAGRLPHLVVDPVMVATSGDRLLEEEAERDYRDVLLPCAEATTPNLAEAEVLLGARIGSLADQHEAARELGRLCPGIVVVTGGHTLRDTERVAVDVVWDGATTSELQAPRVSSRNTHGTGCTFSAAIAGELARGLDPTTAVAAAKSYVTRAVTGAAAWRLGNGHGPLDHFGWSAPS